jgi:hypothetical protein
MVETDPNSYAYGMWVVDTVDDKFTITPAFVKYLVDHQDKDLRIAAEHYSLKETGLYELLDCFSFNSVTIYTWNTLETHHKYNIVQYNSKLYMLTRMAWGKWIVTKNDQEWDGKYRFLTMYGRPTAYRLGVASYLHAHYSSMAQIYLAGTHWI